MRQTKREGRGPSTRGRETSRPPASGPEKVPVVPHIWRSPDRVENPRISLIIPALNEEKLIGAMLGTFPEEILRKVGAEIVVSDGGSTDRTDSIARERADMIITHRESRRQTIAEGRNLGASIARGDLLVFINADTLPQDPSGFLHELDRIATSGLTSNRIVAWACPVAIAPEERRLSDTLFHGFFNRYVRLLNLIGLGMGRGECQVIFRDPFVEVSGYQDHMAAGEDFDLYRRLAENGKIGHSDALRVYESPRRFRRFGYLRVLFEWTLNGLAVMILGRSISKEWEEIR